MKSFEVIYDDFSGGHFVGGVGTKQPKNTFVGYNVAPDPLDGTLIALETPFVVTAALPDLAANASRPILTANGIVWASNANAYKFDPSGTPNVAVSSVAIAGAVLPNCQPIEFNGEVLFPRSAAASFVRVNPSTMAAASSGATVQTPNLAIAWGQFVLHTSATSPTNRVWFSNPGTVATFTSTDFFDVGTGDVSSQITGWCVHQGSLYILAGGSWWVATGVPGSTLSLRQITGPNGDRPPALTSGQQSPVSIDTTVLTVPGAAIAMNTWPSYGSHVAVSELAGNRTRPLNLGLAVDGREPKAMLELARFADHAVASTALNFGSAVDEGGGTTVIGATLWILNFTTGVWVRRQLPTLTPKRLGTGGGTASDLAFFRTGSPDTEQLYLFRLSWPGLTTNQDGTHPTATAELAEYYHSTPFTVKEIICEVDYGSPANTATNDRYLTVSVKTPGSLVEAEQTLDMSRSESSQITHILPARNQTGANYTRRRSFVRFNPTDGSDTYTATPVITLSGVKLRRVVMRCEERN